MEFLAISNIYIIYSCCWFVFCWKPHEQLLKTRSVFAKGKETQPRCNLQLRENQCGLKSRAAHLEISSELHCALSYILFFNVSTLTRLCHEQMQVPWYPKKTCAGPEHAKPAEPTHFPLTRLLDQFPHVVGNQTQSAGFL